MKRIVVKVGSNVLTCEDGKLDITRLSSIVDQVVWVLRHDYQVILVSSGSVTSGKGEMKALHKLDSIQQRQLYSAMGQVKLMALYYDLFREYGIHIGQVLTMKESFATRREYLNQRSCMQVMLENNVVPIVNENDTVSLTELMFTDNDELSGLIAAMMGAETLVILSNIDGVYTGSPKDPSSKLIEKVQPGQDLSEFIQTEKSGFGRGGMITKSNISRKVADEGIRVIIANGKRDNILRDLIENRENTPHTEFVPNPHPTSDLKKWLAHSDSFAKGKVVVSDIVVKALLEEKRVVSILMVGVESIEGEFEEGEIVNIFDQEGRRFAVGRSSYDSNTARVLIGKKEVKPMVHYDYLYIE